MAVSAGLAGCAESHKLSLRVTELEKFLRFVSSARTEIRYTALPVEELIRRHGGELALWKPCMESLEQGKSFSEAWNDGVRNSGKMGLTGRDRELLENFGSGLGVTDIEGQLAHCGLYEELTKKGLEEAKEEKGKKARLYQMLGFSAGLAAALLLW